METKISEDANIITVEVENADVSLGYIIRHEFLKNSNCVSAGVIKPHPLISKFTMRFETKKENSKEIIIQNSSIIDCSYSIATLYNSELIMKDCTFSDNGGGIEVSSSCSIQIDKCVFKNNYADKLFSSYYKNSNVFKPTRTTSLIIKAINENKKKY